MTGPRTQAAPGEWRAQAACLDHDFELWFPTGIHDDWRTPKAICKGQCPVRDACLTFAMTNGEKDGIWGGLDPEERRLLRLRQTKAARKNRRKEMA